jgi:hypothetical protein
MGDTSLIRATLLVALLTAMGLIAAGRAPAAESTALAAADSGLKAAYGNAAISFPAP